MKVMEIIIRDEIYAHCKNLISYKQYGLLPPRSCTTQLIHAIWASTPQIMHYSTDTSNMGFYPPDHALLN